jgi:hypothetical protein
MCEDFFLVWLHDKTLKHLCITPHVEPHEGTRSADVQVRLIPDAEAVPVPLPWRPGHAIVMASMHTRPGLLSRYRLPTVSRLHSVSL